jgi:hypothetical protein
MLSGKQVYMRKSPSYLKHFPRTYTLDGNEVVYNKLELSNGDTLYFKLGDCENMPRGVLKVRPENRTLHMSLDELSLYFDDNPEVLKKLTTAISNENIDRQLGMREYSLYLGRGQTLTLTLSHDAKLAATLKRKSAELFGSDVQKVIDSDPALKGRISRSVEFI